MVNSFLIKGELIIGEDVRISIFQPQTIDITWKNGSFGRFVVNKVSQFIFVILFDSVVYFFTPLSFFKLSGYGEF